MKVFLTRLAVFAVVAAALAACEGQNPFKPQANPAKNYSNLLGQAKVAYSPDAPRTSLPIADSNPQLVCGSVFDVAVENDHSNKGLTFIEETPRTYNLTIRSTQPGNFTVQATKKPAEASFSSCSGDGTRPVTCTFSWNPSKSYGDNEARPLILTFKSNSPDPECATATQELSLYVGKNTNPPTITFNGFPQNKIEFGDSFKFEVQITDPAAVKNQAPILNAPAFQVSAETGNQPVLDASHAVDCEGTGRVVNDTTWAFECSLNTNALKQEDIDAYKRSGKIINAVFFESATSRRGGNLTPVIEAPAVQIEFPKLDNKSSANDPGSANGEVLKAAVDTKELGAANDKTPPPEMPITTSGPGKEILAVGAAGGKTPLVAISDKTAVKKVQTADVPKPPVRPKDLGKTDVKQTAAKPVAKTATAVTPSVKKAATTSQVKPVPAKTPAKTPEKAPAKKVDAKATPKETKAPVKKPTEKKTTEKKTTEKKTEKTPAKKPTAKGETKTTSEKGTENKTVKAKPGKTTKPEPKKDETKAESEKGKSVSTSQTLKKEEEKKTESSKKPVTSTPKNAEKTTTTPSNEKPKADQGAES